MANNTDFRAARRAGPWAKPGKVKRIRNLQVLEGSLVDEPANVGSRVVLFKRHDKDKVMDIAEIQKRLDDPDQPIFKSDANAMLEDYLGEIEPTMDVAQALLKHWGTDGYVASLYELHQAAEPDVEPVPVAKRAEPGGEVWAEITKAALELVDQAGGRITKAEAVDQLLIEQPALYTAYLREQRCA